MLFRLHFGQNKGKSRSTVLCRSRSRVFAPQTGQRIHFSSGLLTAFTSLRIPAMNQAKKEPDMVSELFQTLLFSFRLAVANTDERHDRCDIHHGQCVRIFCANFTGCNQGAENTGVVVQDAFHISPRIECRQLRRTKLLNGHHAAESADRFVAERIFKDLPYLFKEGVLCGL